MGLRHVLAEIIRQGLYRGADTGWLLTDRLFAGCLTHSRTFLTPLATGHPEDW